MPDNPKTFKGDFDSEGHYLGDDADYEEIDRDDDEFESMPTPGIINGYDAYDAEICSLGY
jgi:hypothetical protein